MLSIEERVQGEELEDRSHSGYVPANEYDKYLLFLQQNSPHVGSQLRKCPKSMSNRGVTPMLAESEIKLYAALISLLEIPGVENILVSEDSRFLVWCLESTTFFTNLTDHVSYSVDRCMVSVTS